MRPWLLCAALFALVVLFFVPTLGAGGFWWTDETRHAMGGVFMLDLLRDMPRDVHRLLQSARRGKLQMHIEVDTLRAFGVQVDRAANRLTMGIITASLVIGSSIVMNSVGGGVSNRWLMALGVLGFVGAALCGVWILFSIWRSGRR